MSRRTATVQQPEQDAPGQSRRVPAQETSKTACLCPLSVVVGLTLVSVLWVYDPIGAHPREQSIWQHVAFSAVYALSSTLFVGMYFEPYNPKQFEPEDAGIVCRSFDKPYETTTESTTEPPQVMG